MSNRSDRHLQSAMKRKASPQMDDEAGFDEATDAMIFYAFRYCLGRESYAVKQCVDYLIAHWGRLSDNTRLLITVETRRALDRNETGMRMDEDHWRRLLERQSAQAAQALSHKEALTERAIEALRTWTRPIHFEMDITFTVGLIGTLQLAFRHPHNAGPTRQMLESFVRDLISQLDPLHGDLYEFLMLGFDERADE